MAGSSTEDYDAGGSSSSFIEGMSNEERCPSVDSLAEWRSSEQVENGIPSTSPPYWDTDDDDDGGLKPSDLYGKHTWKIENFSQLNKREMRSNAFEVGGYKWYILIYPQGCDVSNHLSLFLCVSQHEKLLPGWGHFAQFTIAVVNKDCKKSKYSDTLHRFWKKEHDWGWKKFIELSKVSDGFIVADTLIIKAQVQVIREKAHRPFRCLDRNYRRELVRIYLSNVEQICRRFVEEKRSKLNKLIEDKLRWSSFRAFWLGVDQISRRRMSREKTDSILKVVVKQFFVDKEVTSTLVMDSLYSGLKALEWQSKNREDKERPVDAEELPAPMVYVEKDMFVLADDVLLLLGRLAHDPLPLQPSPPKDDKGYQNRTKDESSGEELNKDKDLFMRDERCLTELGRRTVEIFVLGHIFSNNIETAYKEAVALKRQEELIREEEAAGQVESELKAKRNAAEKEKRARKKQAKQKRNTRKVKDVGRVEKSHVILTDKNELESQADDTMLESPPRPTTPVPEKTGKMTDASIISDVPEILQPELDDKNGNTVNWDTDASEVHPSIEFGGNGKLVQTEYQSHSMVDDSCSTCSTDSVPSVATNGPDNGNVSANSLSYNQVQPARGKNQNGDIRGEKEPASDCSTGAAHLCDKIDNCKDSQPEPAVLSKKDSVESVEQHTVTGKVLRDHDNMPKKEVLPLQKSLNSRDQVDFEKPNKSRPPESSSSPASSVKRPQFDAQPAKQLLENNVTAAATTPDIGSGKEFPSINHAQIEKISPPATRSLQVSSASKSEIPKLQTPSKSSASHQVTLTPSARPTPIVSTSQTSPLLSRSVSAAGRLGTEPSPSAPSYVPLSYRNATSGKTTMGSPASFGSIASTSSSQAVSYSQPPSPFLSSVTSMFPPQTSARNGANPPKPGFTFGSVKPETLHSWKDERYSHQEASTSGTLNGPSLSSEIDRLDIQGRHSWKDERYPREASSSAASSQAQGTLSEEFPHLGIINDLLDDDPNLYKAANGHHHSFNRQYTFPRDVATASNHVSLGDNSMFDPNEQYYGEGFQRVYGSSNGHLHGLGDVHHRQMELLYGNGQIDMVSQTQWPYQHADRRMVNMGSVDVNGYPYQFQDYSNSTSAENGGYSIYRPSNGI